MLTGLLGSLNDRVPVKLTRDGKLRSVLRHPARVPESYPHTQCSAASTTSVEEAPPASHYLLVPYFIIQGSLGVATVTPTSLAEPVAC